MDKYGYIVMVDCRACTMKQRSIQSRQSQIQEISGVIVLHNHKKMIPDTELRKLRA